MVPRSGCPSRLNSFVVSGLIPHKEGPNYFVPPEHLVKLDQEDFDKNACLTTITNRNNIVRNFAPPYNNPAANNPAINASFEDKLRLMLDCHRYPEPEDNEDNEHADA